jgi:transposase InsO family protein
MIHVDVKKLGRIPNGGGHRIHGRVQGETNSRARNLVEGRPKVRGQVRGYTFLHHAVDDHSRFVYSEILPNETKETAPAFMRNAIAAFTVQGVKVQRVLTDNGSCYRSLASGAVLVEGGIRHKRTRPYRPQTNGKVCEDLSWCCVRSSLTPAKV